MKKLEYEFIKNNFEIERYTLLSKEYKNSKSKLDYICPSGHKHSTIWNNWKKGGRCPNCSNRIKKTIEHIKVAFEKEKCCLLSNTYINNKTKLKYICKNGHKHSIRWCNWLQGQRCPSCTGLIKPTIEYINNEFNKENYKLLSNVYHNNHTKLHYICFDGHKNSISWNNWCSGHRCPTCAVINNFGANNPAWAGGVSYEPYCHIWKDRDYLDDIKNRDGYTCLNPVCNLKNSNNLIIHHVDYNKKNCAPTNLITVCRSCNAVANKDREWHTVWYQAILNKRYNYKY